MSHNKHFQLIFCFFILISILSAFSFNNSLILASADRNTNIESSLEPQHLHVSTNRIMSPLTLGPRFNVSFGENANAVLLGGNVKIQSILQLPVEVNISNPEYVPPNMSIPFYINTSAERVNISFVLSFNLWIGVDLGIFGLPSLIKATIPVFDYEFSPNITDTSLGSIKIPVVWNKYGLNLPEVDVLGVSITPTMDLNLNFAVTLHTALGLVFNSSTTNLDTHPINKLEINSSGNYQINKSGLDKAIRSENVQVDSNYQITDIQISFDKFSITASWLSVSASLGFGLETLNLLNLPYNLSLSTGEVTNNLIIDSTPPILSNNPEIEGNSINFYFTGGDSYVLASQITLPTNTTYNLTKEGFDYFIVYINEQINQILNKPSILRYEDAVGILVNQPLILYPNPSSSLQNSTIFPNNSSDSINSFYNTIFFWGSIFFLIIVIINVMKNKK